MSCQQLRTEPKQNIMDSRYSSGGSAHHRDSRHQLFSSAHSRVINPLPPARMESPYGYQSSQALKHNEAYLLSLESQNNDDLNTMSTKVAALKNLGLQMGDEINKSLKLNEDLTERFERGKISLKHTYNRMIEMSKSAGITWKLWLIFFFLFFSLCFYLWLF